MNNLTEIVPFASVVTITIGLVQAIKYADQEDRFVRFYPLVSVFIGFLLSFFVFHLDAIVAIVTGLSAGGTYEVGKRTVLGIVASSTPPTVNNPLPGNSSTVPEPPPMGSTAASSNT